jgi:uncharacterized protein YlxW (UPF0749 family)
VWRTLVPLTVGVAGLVLTTSATTARGTDLRAAPTRLGDLVDAQERANARLVQTERRLRDEVAAATGEVAQHAQPVAAARQHAAALGPAAGLTAVHGPGVEVALDDAPTARGARPAGASPDDLVVHQQDVQGVVNALWAGGAEAMTIVGKRVVSTTAVRCVGNTLLLQGAVYSPPFTVGAIGPVSRMTAALDADPDVSIFRQYVAVYGLGYRVTTFPEQRFPAYDGPLDMGRP